jgi:hypothetical protein
VEGGVRRGCMLLNINGLMGAARGMAAAALIGKWFFMNDLTRGGGRLWESGDWGRLKQSAVFMVCGPQCI